MAPPKSTHNPHELSREPLHPSESKWLRAYQSTYVDPLGHERTWEFAERTTRPPGVDIDGVGIIAILTSPDKEPELILQKQFRPPVNMWCIEIPAGLIDKGETPEECAIRELREETGYVGVVESVEISSEKRGEVGFGGERSCVMFNDPGFCNTNLNYIHVKVDLTDPRNQDPKQELEAEEYIEVFTWPLSKLYEQCRVWDREGYAVDARVGSLAEGFEVAKKYKFL